MKSLIRTNSSYSFLHTNFKPENQFITLQFLNPDYSNRINQKRKMIGTLLKIFTYLSLMVFVVYS